MKLLLKGKEKEAREALDQARKKFDAKQSELIGCSEELDKNLEECSERAQHELERQGMKLELKTL